MFPLLIAMGRNLPIIGDLIKAFDSPPSPRYPPPRQPRKYAVEF